jgi:hypothetical protein
MPRTGPRSFAAQFALSHACWLVTYPLSGWLMTQFGPVAASGRWRRWQASARWRHFASGLKEDPEILEHTHDNLPLDFMGWPAPPGGIG